eukprot:339031_1
MANMLEMLTIIICVVMDTIVGYGTCDDGYHIQKWTIASSNSYRDSYYAFNIFAYLDEQDTEHFISGMCANGMKVQLPDSCFQLHAPQTWQHDSGLLDVAILEKKFNKKWQHVLSTNKDTFNYDSFLDFNIAFWVQSLDDYIEKWQQFAISKDKTDTDFGPVQFQYIGIEWYYKLTYIDLQIKSTDYKNNKFYSLLIHSPQSGINYEFISFKKPSDKYYKNIKWISSDIQRATFIQMNDPYPWNRPDKALIIPVRISRATTNLDEMLEFYMNVMEAKLLYNSNGVIVDTLGGDNVATKTAFLIAGDTKIELQFSERESWYTAGDFTLRQYELLLIETHDEVITTPFCGIDRWFDNHYGFDTWSNYGYLDRIIERLNVRNKQKYRVYKTPYEHSSPHGKIELDKYGADATYIFFVFEPSGQTIQMMGGFPNYDFNGYSVPNWNAQWCYTRCQGNMRDGFVNQQNIYIDNEIYDDSYNKFENFNENVLQSIYVNDDSISKNKHMFVVLIIFAVCFAVYCIYIQWQKQRLVHKNICYDDNHDQTPLIIKQ